ncbi:N-acetyllactosaminide beta-1,3-N-acetylglucosaminyltransferase 2-like [Pseudoliparis swirei]|uniref:N-acetyllactosaminide beta-1,3-N-acetylglucosaminyltransferase 2-like n=1 Tax=Pseudoliparis swirei TaxID=2059687 RepID=UPI0024BD6257|nr:N-acetyllactosaminide beta-1,3-N-acetylglucosaminyltransferase 2-like [Pseudoliparis swirei]
MAPEAAASSSSSSSSSSTTLELIHMRPAGAGPPSHPTDRSPPHQPQTQRRGAMQSACQKARLLCVALAALVCLLVATRWNFRRDRADGNRIRIPTARFWHRRERSRSFWNKEQEYLDFVHNPIISSPPADGSLAAWPDWLNDTGPRDPCEPDRRVAEQIADYVSLPQRLQDFLLHMRCRTYPMLIDQPAVCAEEPFLLLAVKSPIAHFDRRQAIRETWGRAGAVANRTVATVFLLGNGVPADFLPDLRGMLRHEAALHGDLLQWDYRDSFYNLTLKEVLFQEWFARKCRRARFVLKGDDDVFINTPRVLELLGGLEETKVKDFFIGDVISRAGPHRDRKLKYFVPESVFAGGYPPYAGGGGYLYSGELALRLRAASRRMILYPIDDVYTGMCLAKLGLAPEDHAGFKTFNIDEKYRFSPCVYRSLMLVHSRTPQEMKRIWSWISHPELVCP